MTGRIGSAATARVVEFLKDGEGLGAKLWAISPAAADLFRESQIHEGQVASDLAEKTAGVKYPAVYVYCDKIINDQVEKFRSFSGRVLVAVEVRLSQDR